MPDAVDCTNEAGRRCRKVSNVFADDKNEDGVKG